MSNPRNGGNPRQKIWEPQRFLQNFPGKTRTIYAAELQEGVKHYPSHQIYQ